MNPNLLQSKRCSRCKETKPVAEFNRKADGWQSRCRECCKWIQLEIRYKVTQAEYEAQFIVQGGCCNICKQTPNTTLVVDHDHNTGRMRGLLCSNCNVMIGYAADDPQRLRDAAEYLERVSNGQG